MIAKGGWLYVLAMVLMVSGPFGLDRLAYAETPMDIGGRRELLIDHTLIDSMDGTALKMHRPQPAGTAIDVDKPWEGYAPFSYVTVFQDGDVFRMYFRTHMVPDRDGTTAELTCYAESKDGIHWTKPNLGIHEVMGTMDNNVVLANAAPSTHNFAPFIDTRPGVPEDERYKAIASGPDSTLVAFVSADGIHWEGLRDEPVFRDSGWVFDSQNVAFWSETEDCYLLYYRKAPDDVRAIARATSKDFVNWSEPEMMIYSDTGTQIPNTHLYTNQTVPYWRAPHIYIALAARFMPGRQVITDAQAQSIGLPTDPAYPADPNWLQRDCSETVLMTTRGGNRYDFTFLEGYVRPGRGLRNWVSRSNYPARGIIQTGPGEMSIFVRRHNNLPSAFLERLTLRLDGFASLNAPFEGGEMITKPVVFSGNALELNYSTGAAGFIQVELQDADGEALEGFSIADCPEIIGDEPVCVVIWNNGADLASLAGEPVRLRFVMKDADLYAFRFAAE